MCFSAGEMFPLVTPRHSVSLFIIHGQCWILSFWPVSQSLAYRSPTIDLTDCISMADRLLLLVSH